MGLIAFTLNGNPITLDVDPTRTLLDVLRNDLRLTGTKHGCGEGDCGACTVLLDGRPYNSCLLIVGKVDGHRIETVEGLATDGKLHPLQTAFLEEGALQCGFCTPGMLLAAKALIDANPHPTEDEV